MSFKKDCMLCFASDEINLVLIKTCFYVESAIPGGFYLCQQTGKKS